MAGTGRRVKFHGAFGSKSKAKAKERKVGGYVRRTRIKGRVRYMVLTRRKGR
jgi:hypothetical protein